MPYTDECSNRMEMALLKENPPSKAFFLSTAVVGGPHSRACGILWGCGSHGSQAVVLTTSWGRKATF